MRFTTPAKASEPYIKLAGPLIISIRSKHNYPFQSRVHRPTAGPSCLIPSNTVKMRLNPQPSDHRLGHIWSGGNSADSWYFAMASIMFVDKFVVRYCLLTEAIATGDFLISVALVDPRDYPLPARSVALWFHSTLLLVAPVPQITFDNVLSPPALLCT